MAERVAAMCPAKPVARRFEMISSLFHFFAIRWLCSVPTEEKLKQHLRPCLATTARSAHIMLRCRRIGENLLGTIQLACFRAAGPQIVSALHERIPSNALEINGGGLNCSDVIAEVLSGHADLGIDSWYEVTVQGLPASHRQIQTPCG